MIKGQGQRENKLYAHYFIARVTEIDFKLHFVFQTLDISFIHTDPKRFGEVREQSVKEE